MFPALQYQTILRETQQEKHCTSVYSVQCTHQCTVYNAHTSVQCTHQCKVYTGVYNYSIVCLTTRSSCKSCRVVHI